MLIVACAADSAGRMSSETLDYRFSTLSVADFNGYTERGKVFESCFKATIVALITQDPYRIFNSSAAIETVNTSPIVPSSVDIRFTVYGPRLMFPYFKLDFERPYDSTMPCSPTTGFACEWVRQTLRRGLVVAVPVATRLGVNTVNSDIVGYEDFEELAYVVIGVALGNALLFLSFTVLKFAYKISRANSNANASSFV
jgi:hypothetical protein